MDENQTKEASHLIEENVSKQEMNVDEVKKILKSLGKMREMI